MTLQATDDPRGVALARRVSTGIDGLDAVLRGGLPEGYMYVVQGVPGVGKTTVGLHFLLAGIEAGQDVLYLTLSHSASELDAVARSHGWSLEGMPVYEFSAVEASDRLTREQTVFSQEEIDTGELVDPLVEAIAARRPERVVVDAVEQLRLLSDRPQRYRRQLLLLQRALADLDCCTTLFLADLPSAMGDHELEAMVHGVIQLERKATPFGSVFRRLQVSKGRGMAYRDGYHTFRIAAGGIEVFPRVQDSGRRHYREWRPAPSGVDGLDELLGGGLNHGTSCLVVGAVGTGKSALVTRVAVAAAARGERVNVYLTDEREETFDLRAAWLGGGEAEGHLSVGRVDPVDRPHGAFAEAVRHAVDDEGATVVVLDSLTGYLTAMEEAGPLINQVRDLVDFLCDRGVLTLLVMTEAGLGARGRAAPDDIGCLADTVIALRRREADGRARREVSIVKRRHGPHEDAIAELRIDPGGVVVAGTASADTGRRRPRAGSEAPASHPDDDGA